MTRAGLTLPLLAFAVALSRLPFLGVGYGSDMDAWSVASAARWIAEHGRYGASRLPGHPVQELTCALLWRGGPWALNGATAAMSVAAAVAFARLLGTLRVRDAWLGGIALAFTPAVFIHSTDSMDFVWALAFLIVSLDAALRGRAALAGVMLGLAVGCRITSAAMLPTLALLIAARDGPPRAVARTGPGGRAHAVGALLLAAAVVGGLALAPMITRFGWASFVIYPRFHRAGVLDVMKNGVLELWGPVGTVALVGVVAATTLAPRRRGPGLPPAELAAWLLGAGIFTASFLLHPEDAGYLLPAVPLVLILAARLLARAGFVALCAALIVSALTFEIAEIGKADSPPPSRLAIALRIAGRSLVIDPLQGPVTWDHARRGAQLRHRDRIRAAIDGQGADAMLISDGWTAYLTVDHRAPAVAAPRFVHGLDAQQAAQLRARGVRIFYLPEAQWNYRASHGVGLESLGAEPLPGIGPPRGPGDALTVP